MWGELGEAARGVGGFGGEAPQGKGGFAPEGHQLLRETLT